eukprot:9142586-Heterocapsa_arctica.AAC.1
MTGDKDALVIEDLFSNLKQLCPVKSKYLQWLHFSSFKELLLLKLCMLTTPEKLSKLVKS